MYEDTESGWMDSDSECFEPTEDEIRTHEALMAEIRAQALQDEEIDLVDAEYQIREAEADRYWRAVADVKEQHTNRKLPATTIAMVAAHQRWSNADSTPPMDSIPNAVLALVWKHRVFERFMFSLNVSAGKGRWMVCENGFWSPCPTALPINYIQEIASSMRSAVATAVATQTQAVALQTQAVASGLGSVETKEQAEALLAQLTQQRKVLDKLCDMSGTRQVAVIEACPLLHVDEDTFSYEMERILIGSTLLSTRTLNDEPHAPHPMEFKMARSGGAIVRPASDDLLWAASPTFRSFMELHFTDPSTPEWEAFMRVLAAITLYNPTGSKIWLHLMGVGNAGKDTVLEHFIPAIVGSARVGLLNIDAIRSSSTGMPPERAIAPLEGARVGVVREEVGDGLRVNVTMLKSIVNGSGTLRAAAKYQPERSFEWAGSLVTHGNTPPKLHADLPVMNRLVLIPFTKHFPIGVTPQGLVEAYRSEARFFARLVVNAGQRWLADGGTRDALRLPVQWIMEKQDMAASADDTLPLVKCWVRGDLAVSQRFVSLVIMELARARNQPVYSGTFWMPAVKRHDPSIKARKSNGDAVIDVAFVETSGEDAVSVTEVSEAALTVARKAMREGKTAILRAAERFLVQYGRVDELETLKRIQAYNP